MGFYMPIEFSLILCYNTSKRGKIMDKKKYYSRIFHYFKDEKKLIFLYLITSLILVAINTITPVISAKLMTAITEVALNSMILLAAIYALFHAIDYLIMYFNNRCSAIIQNKVEIKIKEDVSKELFELEMKNFDKEGTGFFANRIDVEPRVLAGIFSNIRYYLISILTSIGVLIFVVYTNPIIGLFLMFSSMINFFIQKNRIKQWEEERKKSNEMHEKYASDFGELIRGIKDIKVLNLKNFLIAKTTKEQKEIILYEDSIAKKNERVNVISNYVTLIIKFLFIVLGVALIKYDNLSGASFLIIYMYESRVSYLISNINSLYRYYKDFNLSLERLYEVVDGVKYPKEKYGTKKISNIKGNIKFENVTFSYDETLVLRNISFSIEEYQTIGIVGKSGAGKSTIINLINKLYDLREGRILIDDHDLSKITEESLRENITTITQNPYIFNMSIKDNLKIANPKASDKEIAEKCKQCALDEYISSLEKGYDTMVGENGVILSGGLKQRLAIARAILKNSKIIMLDEATSSLDNETQDFIHHSIKKIRKDYTILIIAHRLSTVIDCDKILVLNEGKIVGFDTHENLVKNNKYYHNLYKKELS